MQRSESRVEIAYEFGFRDLRDAITGERARRDLAQGLHGLLTTVGIEKPEEDGPDLQPQDVFLMLEALHNSFPDEVGEPDQAWEIDRAWASERPLEIAAADPEEFRNVVGRLLDRAEDLEEAILATNDGENQILLLRTSDGQITELDMIMHQGVARREIIIWNGPTICCIRHMIDYEHSGKEYSWELRITQTGSDAQENGGQLTGITTNDGTESILTDERIVNSVNHMLGSIGKELKDRQMTAARYGVL